MSKISLVQIKHDDPELHIRVTKTLTFIVIHIVFDVQANTHLYQKKMFRKSTLLSLELEWTYHLFRAKRALKTIYYIVEVW